MRTHVLEKEQILDAPLKKVYPFFATPENLARITPKRLDFRVITPGPVEMKPGAVFDYEIRVAGLPVRWTTLIETVEPFKRFVDIQLKGPYAYWHHTHTFSEKDGRTVVGDRVVYALPFGPVGNLVHSVWVRRDLENIFRHRAQVVQRIFAELS